MKKPVFYFAGSIRGGREDQELYRRIIEFLGHYGTVVTEHVGREDLADSGEKDLSDEQIFHRDLEWLRSADCLVAEVSTPSLDVV